ncbi:7785_t:CDS:2 [Paraglomus brasilianum]|uniref:7785_t:CDS:1 n=1 Tax=Paraglomus brasilianum TaxID=144538 RepID=A0A9N8ZZF3_9GLOM|nr:7785_t:CDS:2 [Paraglomus brasilianum]
MSSKAQSVIQFIVERFENLNRQRRFSLKPLIIGISGIQGCGKTTLVSNVVRKLDQDHNLVAVSFSADDFVHTYEKQVQIKLNNSQNRLLEKRGLPGTHDVAFCRDTFAALCKAQYEYATRIGETEKEASPVLVPKYDKSCYNGKGDRVPEDQWQRILPPIDCILFDGWFLGFKHLPDEVLSRIYNDALRRPNGEEKPLFLSHALSHLLTINNNLKEYETSLYPFIDIFIHIDTEDINVVYKWRLEQEHRMIAKGMTGMTDIEVKEFVNRYMPAYELYLPKLRENSFFEQNGHSFEDISGRHLRLLIDENRDRISEVIL